MGYIAVPVSACPSVCVSELCLKTSTESTQPSSAVNHPGLIAPTGSVSCLLFLSCLLLLLSCLLLFLSCLSFLSCCYCFFHVCVLLFLSGSRSMPACAPNIALSETRIRVCCAANTVDSFSAKSSLHADAKKKKSFL